MRAYGVSSLRASALERIMKLTSVEIGQLVSFMPGDAPASDPVIERAMTLFRGASSFKDANEVISRVVIPLVPSFSEPQIREILDAAKIHSEYPETSRTPSLLSCLREHSLGKERFSEEFRSRGLQDKFHQWTSM